MIMVQMIITNHLLDDTPEKSGRTRISLIAIAFTGQERG
jgi:hypothetical protein